MATSILLKFLTLKWNISRAIWHIEIGDGSLFCIFHTLSFEPNFFSDRRFPLTTHERPAVAQNLKKMMEVKQSETSSMKEMRTARISRDESDVRKVAEVLETWINPFDPSEEFSSLSSGAVVPKDIKDELLGAKKIGENAAMAFMEDHIISNETELYDPISKKKLKTFSAL